jgi:hypothetical protein
MALLNSPEYYPSAHGDLVYVFSSTNYTQPNFKYVLELYDSNTSTLIAKLKVYPNPSTGYGVFNVGNVVRNYVSSPFAPDLTKNTWVQSISTFALSLSWQLFEEYGVPLTSTFITANSNDPRSNTPMNYYYGRIFTTNPSTWAGGNYYWGTMNYRYDFATNRPTNTKVLYSNNVVLLPKWVEDLSSGSLCSNRVNLYLSVTSLSGTTTTYTKSLSQFTLTSYYMNQFNVSPQALNSEFGSSVIPSNTNYYEIRMTFKLFSGCTELGTTTKRFYIYCEPKYTPITLVWLNKQGGFDSYDFSKVSKRSIDIEKKSFSKLNYSINASTGLMTNYNQTTLNENQVVYDSKYKEKLILNTDIIDEETYAWLGELVVSPNVYIQSGNNFIPIQIKSSTYEYKTKVVDKIFNLTLNAEYDDIINAQYR